MAVSGAVVAPVRTDHPAHIRSHAAAPFMNVQVSSSLRYLHASGRAHRSVISLCLILVAEVTSYVNKG